MTLSILQTEDESEGEVKSVKLVLHGTKNMPHHVKSAGGARKYDYNYNDVQNIRVRHKLNHQEFFNNGILHGSVVTYYFQNQMFTKILMFGLK